jgi:hypothetical protein
VPARSETSIEMPDDVEAPKRRPQASEVQRAMPELMVSKLKLQLERRNQTFYGSSSERCDGAQGSLIEAAPLDELASRLPMVSKYCDHLPLYRQSRISGRAGMEIHRSTIAGWVGQVHDLFDPLVVALWRYMLAAHKVHAVDTPVKVLTPGQGRLAGIGEHPINRADDLPPWNIAGRQLQNAA